MVNKRVFVWERNSLAIIKKLQGNQHPASGVITQWDNSSHFITSWVIKFTVGTPTYNESEPDNNDKKSNSPINTYLIGSDH